MWREAPLLCPQNTFRTISPVRWSKPAWDKAWNKAFLLQGRSEGRGEQTGRRTPSSLTRKLPNTRRCLRLPGKARTASERQPGDRNAGARKHGSHRLTTLPAAGHQLIRQGAGTTATTPRSPTPERAHRDRHIAPQRLALQLPLPNLAATPDRSGPTVNPRPARRSARPGPAGKPAAWLPGKKETGSLG